MSIEPELTEPVDPTGDNEKITTSAPPSPEEPAAPADQAPEPYVSPDAENFGTPEELLKKRNCGRTGPTTPIGKAIAARNATRHGLCAHTLILPNENEADWLELLAAWRAQYASPAESSVLYTFIHKTAAAEWKRLRAEREYDFFYAFQEGRPFFTWHADQVKEHDLCMRYKTSAERTVQREYRMLEHHWHTHCKHLHPKKDQPSQPPPDPKPEPEAEVPESNPAADRKMPGLIVINNETGESIDSEGRYTPPPPDYVAKPIIPGVYDEHHPSNWRKHPARLAQKDPPQ